jgi:asparagine synthase (glutamine-hydrolysing)
MCGLIGAAGLARAPDEALAQAALARLAERGPDDRGLWREQDTLLAHCRLSILDLSPAGHQPMASADGRYVLIYNGEIYNFRELRAELGGDWRSDSDSEVILAAYQRWGKAFLQRLRGMFALGIWDRQERALLLARDRLGVKPLYYALHDGALLFASRPGALFAYRPQLPRDIDVDALALYLEAGYFPAPWSLHTAVRKLPAGHLLEFSGGAARVSRYWDPLGIEPVAAWRERPENDLLDELDALLRRSVQARLVSDVPLGAFLSGGIDSSTVVALMAKLATGPVKTFTIGFREPQYDESRHAETVARMLGTEHRQEVLSVDDLLALVPSFHEYFDEPFFDSSAFPALAVSRLARREVTVALGGDGGDELFGGYHYYSILQRMAPAFRLPQALRGGAAQVIGLAPSHRTRLLAGTLSEDEPLKAFRFMRSIAKDFGSVLLPDAQPAADLDQVFAAAVAQMPKALAPAEQAMRLDLTHILPEEYLQKTDLSSMSYSLEAREPLLDHELVEWSLKLPLEWKLRGGKNKYLLRQLAYRYLPREIVERPKQGFGVPIDRWLRGPLRAWARERLEDRRLYERFPLDRARVLELLDLHLSGKRDTHPLLWAILMLAPFA